MLEEHTKMQKIKMIEEQIKILKEYLIMNVARNDWHSVWDCAIDLARLQDKLEYYKNEQTFKNTE